MNLVLITSVIRPLTDYTIYNHKQRFEQTLLTIESIKKYVPNHYIVICEGGKINDQEFNIFQNNVNYIFRTDILELKKSQGEAKLLYNYLTSDHFNLLKNKISTLSKISGRYYLNENFSWDEFPIDKYIIKRIDQGWMYDSLKNPIPLYCTRYYRIPKDNIDNFIEKLCFYINSKQYKNAWPDIENCFYQLNIIEHKKIFVPKKIGVSGLITNNGQYIED